MEFIDLVDALRSTTKSTEKLDILDFYLKDPENGSYLCYLMQETFDPKRLHNVVIKKKDLPTPGKSHIGIQKESMYELFQLLPSCQSHLENRSKVMMVMEVLTRDDQEALMAIVNKKLRCGVGIKQVNKVVEDLIDVQEIQLAQKYYPEKTYPNRCWYASYKLDGQRVFAIHTNAHGWRLYSRDGDYIGREITTLEHWKPELDRLNEKTGVTYVDGEAYRHGWKFEKIQSLVSSRVNVKDTRELKYNIFYMGRPEGNDLKSKVLLGVSPDQIYRVFIPTTSEDSVYEYLEGLRQEKILNDIDAIYWFLDKAVVQGYEGIILRSGDEWYVFKRSKDLLKVKTSHLSGTEIEVDCYVEDMEYGDFMIREDGVESSEWLPVKLLVILNDQESTLQMKVGSGFTIKNRRAWGADESLIVGKVIEARCQGFGAKGKMRFPRYLRTREDL
jgi:ATP-dependent DNA ligase